MKIRYKLLIMVLLVITGTIAAVNVHNFIPHSTYWYILWFAGVIQILAAMALGIIILSGVLKNSNQI